MKFAYCMFGAIQTLSIIRAGATNCWSEVEVDFMGNKVKVKSSKELSNVVVYDGCTKYKYDDLSGYTGTFYSENSSNDVCIVWVKSGCNHSGDGSGYGEKFEKQGECEPVDCDTTVAPTTAYPTTVYPTTVKPTTTPEPTTAEPTTSEPTTERPTTKMPTTMQPSQEPTKTPIQELYANLVVILDRSASISDQAFNRAKNYVISNIECNKPRYVCVIAFAKKPQMVVQCTTNMVKAKKSLQKLTSFYSGSKALTNVAAAINFALEKNKMPAKSQENTLLLFMSDAKPNLPGYGSNNDAVAINAAEKTAPAIKEKTLYQICLGLDNPNFGLLHKFCDEEDTMHISNPNKPSLCPRL